MKRISGLYQKITSTDNLLLAEKKAKKGKADQYGVIFHNRNKEANLLTLQDMLVSKSYQTSPYKIFKIFEPKEREVYKLPFFPDRITHHAIMNVLEPIFISTFTRGHLQLHQEPRHSPPPEKLATRSQRRTRHEVLPEV